MAQRLRRLHLGAEEAQLLDLGDLAAAHEPHLLAGAELAVDDAHVGDDAAVLVVDGVEDEGACRRRRVAVGRRHARDDGLQDLAHALARLGRHGEDLVGLGAGELVHLELRLRHVGRRQVDLVEHGDDLEVVLDRQVGVGDGLRLDALRGVDEQHRALAGRERARHLVGEVDVTRRVDEVELVVLAVARAVGDAHGLRLDGDAALALEVHAIEELLLHVARAHRAGELEDAVGQRRLAVVDVSHDGEVADVVETRHERAAAMRRDLVTPLE